MDELIISLSQDVLRLSGPSKTGIERFSVTLEPSVADGNQIVDKAAFVEQLKSSLTQLNVKKGLKLVFLLEPEEIYFRFVTLDKSISEEESALVENIKQKIEGVDIDDLYYSFQKIAPFVYQFVGVRKQLVEDYIEIANTLGIPLKALIPWVLVLPKYLPTNDPSVLIVKTHKRHILALAELNGIYFCESLEEATSGEQIQFLVEKLSVYKRNDPIKKIYALEKEDVHLEGFEVLSLADILEIEDMELGFEPHYLTRLFLDKRPDTLVTQVNVLNLLPVPMIVEKSKTAVYAGSVAVGLLVLGGLVGFMVYKNGSNSDKGDVAVNTESTPVVLSEQSPEPNESAENIPEVTTPELDISKLSIRVENGAGVPGVAAKGQEYLESKGYTVAEVGNADETGRNKTLLKFKKSALAYRDKLTEDLKGEYDVEVSEDLSDDSAFDVIVIIGLN